MNFDCIKLCLISFIRKCLKPDLYVYLYQNTERLLANIKKRGRNYEQEIPAEYLEKLIRVILTTSKHKPI